jgi:hypothetical protein
MNAELLGIATVVVVILLLGGFCLVENSDIQLLPEIEEQVIETIIPPTEWTVCFPFMADYPNCG